VSENTLAQHARIGLVLSAGGLRGAAHLGVLRQLQRHGIPIDVIVGVSAGAIIAAYYAAVGLTVDEMIADAPAFKGHHIVMHGMTLRAHRWLKPWLRQYCGVIPRRLEQLEAGEFGRLHHGIEGFGVVCHDVLTQRPCYFSTADSRGARLADVVKASAAMPGVLPPRSLTLGETKVQLVDGGVSDSLPIDFARARGLDATHLIVSDCRFGTSPPPERDDAIVYVRPQLDGLRPLRGPRLALVHAVQQGEAAITDDVIARIRAWSVQERSNVGTVATVDLSVGANTTVPTVATF
jgi:NTE family protein